MSYLGVDVGTSRTKAVVFDEAFKPLAQSSTGYGRICPRPGWYEIDADELGRAVQRVIAECSAQCRADPIRWLSFSVFGGGVTAIDSERRPLLNVISTTDNRAGPQADDWRRRFGHQRTYQITGTTTHPSLMLPKMLWIAAHLENPGRIHQFVTAAEWVQASLGMRPHMDLATASTTMALDIRRRCWSDEILETAGIPLDRLPPLAASAEPVDQLPASICAALGLPPDCVLVAGGHDQQVCALGAGLLETGEATDSLGTVECITTLFDEPRLHDDLLENHFSNLLHVDGEHVATLAYNFCSGDLLEWMRTRFFSSEPSFEAMFAQLPERPSRVLVLPHLAGSGTPRLDSQSKGLIAGLTLQTAATDILRGVIDSQNYEMKLNLEVWRRNGVTFDRLRTYGKGASADVALQIKADILGMAVQRLNVHETGCLGAALLAARGADRDLCFRDVLDRVTAVEKTFLPRHEFADQYDQAYGHYRELYPRLKEVLHGL